MLVVTVATHPDGYFPVLQEACKRHRLKLKVLGFGQKWLGFAWRFQLMQEFLQSIPEDEIVVFVDGY